MIFKTIGFTAKNKIKITTLIFSVLCLILLTNLQEKMMIKRLNETVTSIYEDRVVVGNYILQLSNHNDEIILLLKSQEDIKKAKALLENIEKLNIAYEKTYLTVKEKENFIQFKSYCKQLQNYIESSNPEAALNSSLKAANVLKVLSAIQVEEGKIKLDEVLSMTNTRSILSYLVIGFVIVISILIQKIILSTKPIVFDKSGKENHRLN